MHEALDYAGTAGLDVLDIGCGQGIDVVRYAASGARVTGVDLTPRHAELARAHLAARNLPGTVVLGDAEQLPFDDASFDRASSNGVLHHTPDISAALREARRVLRPGGEARIVVYNRSSLHYWADQVVYRGLLQRRLFAEGSMSAVLSEGVEYSTVGARPLVNVYSPRQIRGLLRDAGFEAVSTRIRHFHAGDAFPAALLESRVKALRDPRVLDRIGRMAGWYVIASGRAPQAGR
jgi:ubiquinone/menaquinone biosynthesis C-methylase UbiE